MTVLQALDRQYARLASRGDVVPPGYSNEPIGVVVSLEEDGHIRAVSTLLDEKGKKPQRRRVPKWFGRSGNGSTPYFLWDNTAFALGVSTKDALKTARDHAAFKEMHLTELAGEADPGLAALRRFLETWNPEDYAASGFTEAIQAWNLAFRLGDDLQLIHERAAAMTHFERLREAGSNAAEGFCLVTGAARPLARLHPKIKGIRGTASAEVPLVSFNLPAFESYGHEQGFNAPTSTATSFRYGAALNWLLDRASGRNRLEIADTTTVFWADASHVGEAAAQAAEDVFAASFLALPDDQTAELQEAAADARVREKLDDVRQGRPAVTRALDIVPGTRFYVLGLSPNAARLSVRFWLEDSFEAFEQRLQHHHDDLRIQPTPWKRPPALHLLLARTTALQEKFDNIPPSLAGEMLRAVLGGGRYPRLLLAAAMIRIRAGDGGPTKKNGQSNAPFDPACGWHAAAIRACLARDHRLGFDPEETPVCLDRDNPNVAYQLGRLFAVMETAQQRALVSVNASIRDRYFGAASATPATVFPLLQRGVQHHLGKLRKEGKSRWLEREMEEIISHLTDALPRSLRLEQQGRFVIGYYHQRRAQNASKPAVTDDIVEDHDARGDTTDVE